MCSGIHGRVTLTGGGLPHRGSANAGLADSEVPTMTSLRPSAEPRSIGRPEPTPPPTVATPLDRAGLGPRAMPGPVQARGPSPLAMGLCTGHSRA